MRWRIALTTACTLILGFAVAVLTGVRPLGGVVLIAGGALCAWWMVRTSGWLRTVIVIAVVFGLFVASHPLGHVIGAWPAVLVVAVFGGAVAYLLARND